MQITLKIIIGVSLISLFSCASLEHDCQRSQQKTSERKVSTFLYEGEVRITYANCDEYEGGYIRDLSSIRPDRRGKHSFASGDSYVGEFKNGVRDGKGIYIWANGERYEGLWRDGVRHGEGTMTRKDGSLFKGIWENGAFLEKVLSPEEIEKNRLRSLAEAEERKKTQEIEAAQREQERLAKEDAQKRLERNRQEAKRQEESERQESERLRQERLFESKRDQRLKLCDSFGFQRGTSQHADCAMKLFISEQQAKLSESSSPKQSNSANAASSSKTQSVNQGAEVIARQRQLAILEAQLQEQERIQKLEASLKLMEFGVNLMTGNVGAGSTPSRQHHTQTYTINGQIITCNTTGSITNCF